MEYVNGKLTRAGMEAVIRAGGAVNVGGRIYARIEDLPSEAVLAVGDTAREAAALRNLDSQIAALTAQRGHLTAAQAAAPAAADAPIVSDTDADPPPTKPGGKK